MPFPYLDKKILIAGAKGMVGQALIRSLKKEGASSLLTPSRKELDYTDQGAVREYFKQERPEVVIVAAAKVGGIYANMTYPAAFLYENAMIAANLIHESYLVGVKRLLYLGSTCIYPREAEQPIREESILTGPLEKTNEAYALAKIAGVKLCQYYRTQYECHYIAAMPTNLYGPGDHYHPTHSHVIPGLMRRFHEAKEACLPSVTVWGSGNAMREFLYIEDLANGCFFLLKHYDGAIPINIGSDEEISIMDLAKKIAGVVGYRGKIEPDLSMPEGTPRKKTELSRIKALGWKPEVTLSAGLKLAYQDFLFSYNNVKNDTFLQPVEG